MEPLNLHGSHHRDFKGLDESYSVDVTLVFHVSPGSRTTHNTKYLKSNIKHAPPLVKLFENGISKWTGAIFDNRDVLLSLPEGERMMQQTGCKHKSHATCIEFQNEN